MKLFLPPPSPSLPSVVTMDGGFLPGLLPTLPVLPVRALGSPADALGSPAHLLLQLLSFTLALFPCSSITSNAKPPGRSCGQVGSNIFSFLFH